MADWDGFVLVTTNTALKSSEKTDIESKGEQLDKKNKKQLTNKITQIQYHADGLNALVQYSLSSEPTASLLGFTPKSFQVLTNSEAKAERASDPIGWGDKADL